LALYDLDGESKWLAAAAQTAYYYETWVYSWNVPIPADDAAAAYPKDRSSTGLSLIATGNNGADTYAAIDAFNFYRTYLYTGDAHLLQFSKMLLQNTKQAVNWNSSEPLPGYGPVGMMMEAMTVTIPRGHGVGYYLPWQTYNMIEPLVLLWDTFGAETYDINVIDGLASKNASNQNYAATRNFVSNNSESIVNGTIYYVINRNSGKALEVTGGGTANGVKIDQSTFEATPAQQWKVVDAGGGYKELIAQCSGKCAEAEAPPLADGANISQEAVTGSNNQLWSIVNVGGGYWKMVNKKTGKVAKVEGSSLASGAHVSQFTDNGAADEQWIFAAK
jgi:Ricin-type beta-trefoil lectin domain-like